LKIEEIQDGLADHETRLLFLENSSPYPREPNEATELPSPNPENISDKEVSQRQKEPVWTNKQWDTVNQLARKVLFLEEKINDHLDKSKRYATRYVIK